MSWTATDSNKKKDLRESMKGREEVRKEGQKKKGGWREDTKEERREGREERKEGRKIWREDVLATS